LPATYCSGLAASTIHSRYTLLHMIPTRRIRLSVVGISLMLFVLSLYLDAARFTENPGTANAQLITHSGFVMFFMALFGPFYGNFAFFANPLLLVGWLMISAQKYRGAAITLFIAFLFTLQTHSLHSQRIYEDEGGVNFSYMTHLLPGWYVWLLSILFPLAAAIYFKWFAPKVPHAPTPEPTPLAPV
jgi:hypothetical protein